MTDVAILGAGYAGITLARRLEQSLPPDVDLVVIDETATHLVQHELHRTLRRPALLDDLVIPLGDLLHRATIVEDRVEAVDTDDRRITLQRGRSLDYRYAAVCLGAETAFHNLPDVERHATPLKRPSHARRIRDDFLTLAGDGGRVVVGGAGLSGVQIAGELAALADEQDRGHAVEVVLLERLDAVVPGFGEDFRAAVRGELDDAGVTVRTDERVTGATDAAVQLESGELAFDQFVWAGGIRGPAALGGDRPSVPGTLRLGGGTFVVGDAARVTDRDGGAVPASAQAAIAEARTAAANIRRLLEHDRTGGDPFEPRLDVVEFSPRGWIVSVGDGAVAQVGPAVLRGPAALALKATAGVGYLTGVGAVGEAIDLVIEEFGAGVRRAGDRWL